MEKLFNDLDLIQEKIGYHFEDDCYLVQAFIRKSFSDEMYDDNSLLIFAGTKVIDLFLTKYCVNNINYETYVTNYSPSNIFSLNQKRNKVFDVKSFYISSVFLAHRFDLLDLNQYIQMGKVDIDNNCTEVASVRADIMKAIIGAIAIDSKWDMNLLGNIIDKLLNVKLYVKNYLYLTCANYTLLVDFWYHNKYGKHISYSYEMLKNGKEIVTVVFPEISDKKYVCKCQYGDDSLNECCRYFYLDMLGNNKRITVNSLIPEEVTIDNSVQILNDLFKNGYISKPKNEYFQYDYRYDNQWRCRTSVEAVAGWYSTTGFDKDKEMAKKIASYELLVNMFDLVDTYLPDDNDQRDYLGRCGEFSYYKNRDDCEKIIMEEFEEKKYVSRSRESDEKKSAIRLAKKKEFYAKYGKYDWTLTTEQEFPSCNINDEFVEDDFEYFLSEGITKEQLQAEIDESVRNNRHERERIRIKNKITKEDYLRDKKELNRL